MLNTTHALLWIIFIEFSRLSLSQYPHPLASDQRGVKLTNWGEDPSWHRDNPSCFFRHQDSLRSVLLQCYTLPIIPAQWFVWTGAGAKHWPCLVSTILAAGVRGESDWNWECGVNQLFFKDRKELIRFVSLVSPCLYIEARTKSLSWLLGPDSLVPVYWENVRVMSSVDLIIESVEVTILGEYGPGFWLLNQESGEKTNGKRRPLQYYKQREYNNNNLTPQHCFAGID